MKLDNKNSLFIAFDYYVFGYLKLDKGGKKMF